MSAVDAPPAGAPAATATDVGALTVAVTEAFLATTRAFSDSVVELCGALGVDAASVLAASGITCRQAAPPPSGSAPTTQGLTAIARTAGLELPIVDATVRTAAAHLSWVANRVERFVGRSISGLRIAVWGLTTEAIGTDLASSPSVRVVDLLLARGAEVAAFDPRLDGCASDRRLAGVELCANPLNACVGASVLVVLEAWPGIEEVALSGVAGLLSQPKVVDVRSAIGRDRLAAAGLERADVGG